MNRQEYERKNGFDLTVSYGRYERSAGSDGVLAMPYVFHTWLLHLVVAICVVGTPSNCDVVIMRFVTLPKCNLGRMSVSVSYNRTFHHPPVQFQETPPSAELCVSHQRQPRTCQQLFRYPDHSQIDIDPYRPHHDVLRCSVAPTTNWPPLLILQKAFANLEGFYMLSVLWKQLQSHLLAARQTTKRRVGLQMNEDEEMTCRSFNTGTSFFTRARHTAKARRERGTCWVKKQNRQIFPKGDK